MRAIARLAAFRIWLNGPGAALCQLSYRPPSPSLDLIIGFSPVSTGIQASDT